jgi:hypothetical protein
MPPEEREEGVEGLDRGSPVERVDSGSPVERVERPERGEPITPDARPELDVVEERPSGLRMYRPTPAGLEPNPVELRSWRSGLRSRRWKPAALANPQLSETSTGMAIAFWLVLAGLTFVALLVGYGTGLWG